MSDRRRRNSEDEKEEEKSVREAARKAFVSLFLGGWDLASEQDQRTGTASEVDDERNHPDKAAVNYGSKDPSGRNFVETLQSPGSNRQGPMHHHASSKQQRRGDASLASSSSSSSSRGAMTQQVADQIDKLLPKDPDALRETALFKEVYKGIQWQRDNYLVGREYANWRRKERYRLDDPRRTVQSFVYEMQYDETALAHGQVAGLAASFIPSDAVRNALLPIVVPVIGTQLYPISRQGLCHVIDSQHDNLHHFLKSQILQFINSPENRAAIKNSTKGLISTTTTYRE